VASPVFKTAWAAVRSPEGSTPFLLRHGCGRRVLLRQNSEIRGLRGIRLAVQ
jgi:hypothetical protein